jgi:RHS repeat-associated protein
MFGNPAAVSFRAALLACVAIGLLPAAARAQTEVVEYYATDALGSIRVVLDAAGNPTASRSDYKPFGEAVNPTGNLPQQRFTGQERDIEAGVDNFNARGLLVRIGRFSRPDPVRGNIYDPQTLNPYAYVGNSPLMYTDPTGLCSRSSSTDTSTTCTEPMPPGPNPVPLPNRGNSGGPGSERPRNPPPTRCQQAADKENCSGVKPPEREPTPPTIPEPVTAIAQLATDIVMQLIGVEPIDDCAAGSNPLFAGKVGSNIAASRWAGTAFDVASVLAMPAGASSLVDAARLGSFVGVVAPYTRGDFTTPEKAVEDREQDVRGAKDAGNFAFYQVGRNYGYSLPFLQAGSVAAAVIFMGNDPSDTVVAQEILSQQVIVGSSRCNAFP